MKWVIKAKSNVQLLSLGKILPSGTEVEYEGKELPKEIQNAQRQGLILVKEVKEVSEVKAPPKTWAKKEKAEKAEVTAAPEPPSIDPPEEKPKKEKKEKKEKKDTKIVIEDKKEDE